MFYAPSALAVDWFPIVPCGSSGQAACTPCDLFKTFKNVIDLVLYGITGPIAAFMIVWAGGLMLISGDNAARFAEGSKMLKNTLIGVTIILLSWLATNTLIKTLATGNAYDAWFEFSCPAYLQQPEAAALPAPVPAKGSPEKPAPELALASAAACKEANLAAANKVPNNTRLISSSLNTLIACINRDPIVSALYDSAQLYTYERKNPLCNLTHGVEVCGDCEHSQFACHYGGRKGNQGAMAVDYNWKIGKKVTYVIPASPTGIPVIVSGDPSQVEPCKTTPSACRTVNGEPGLFDEIYRALVRNRCDYKLVNFERDHTHISTKDCDSDGGAVRGREPPILP
ncbi:MAG: pilin [Patescibacteria group bacterium]